MEPCSKVNKIDGNLCFEKATEVEPEFWKSSSQIMSIFKTRSKNAGLEYFQPHAYKTHLVIKPAMSKAKNSEEIKAISQNFGHEYIHSSLCQVRLISLLSETTILLLSDIRPIRFNYFIDSIILH
ncbi:MAG: hypothetical protein LBS61_03000 [Endomicrobium sp.]|nr:hypothetical protein [Endomicrobium sp.]